MVLTDDGFDEDELQAALNMSMQAMEESPENTPSDATTNETPSSGCDANSYIPPQITIESHELNDIRPFHQIMWDDGITTSDDKERWIYECISTTALGSGTSPSRTSSVSTASTPLEALTGCHTQQSEDIDSKPAAIPDSMHKLWGLTQKHGGPCGVLAAIQAEMIRVLLFGRRLNGGEAGRCLTYPFMLHEVPDNGVATSSRSPITASEVKEALAMAIGMILARAAVMPPSSSSTKESTTKRGNHSVQLVFPESQGDAVEQQQSSSCEGKKNDTTIAWISEMLHANSKSDNTADTSSQSLGLRVHAISSPQLETTTQPQFPSNDNEDDDGSRELKRQKKKKKKEATFAANQTSSTENTKISTEETEQQRHMTVLAYVVADYLMGKTSNHASSSSDDMRPNEKAPLDHFCGPGGVMFFVMSLVVSRGIESIRGDMDDPNTTITSQFGHSSQELINLLLTGQAVSNVFDNSMTVSGELTCRGIQQRPAVGYLSQLEALHYCEVGGYYKSPAFPIWVIGSTSHFSVLFGDEACLQESQSDLLLEKCRRAFKKVEGGGESGFIAVDNFGEVVDELNLRRRLGGDHGVQTLKAFLEVSGAGIILWEDAWKSLSRLLTGSTLESIIDTNNNQQLALVTNEDAAPTDPQSTMQSDEELAKKLAEEWGTNTTSENTNPAADSDEAYARALQAEWDAEMAGNMDANDTTSHVATADHENAGLFGLELSDDDSLGVLGNITENSQEPLVARPPTPIAKHYFSQEHPIARPPTPIAKHLNEQEKLMENTKLMESYGKESGQSHGVRFQLPAAEEKDAITRVLGEAWGNHADVGSTKYDFENYGSNFPLYHYNGLRGGTLTPFRVTRLNASEAVGSSIGLSGGSSHHGSDDLEAVVRTKWPSCTFNWLGKSAPYID